MIVGLNHITLAVSDLRRSWPFYVDLLGGRPHARWEQGAYLSVGELWLCLSLDKAKAAEDYTHIAFSVLPAEFSSCVDRLTVAGVRPWKTNVSEGDSFYFLDPDGHKLELHVGSLQSRLQSLQMDLYPGLELFSD